MKSDGATSGSSLFSERAAGTGLFFVGDHGHGSRIAASVAEGDNVRLMIGEQAVLVSDIKAIGPGLYRGVIAGFNSAVPEYAGFCKGQSVVFTEKQIFECSTP
jgi:hypothetical protein